MISRDQSLRRGTRSQRGSTLLELLVAVALFVIISGVTFSLMNQQQNASMNVNGQSGLNMALRDAVSALQLDLGNAGSNYFQQQNMAGGALGVTIINNVASSSSPCNDTTTNPPTYGSNCFDQINIISADPTSVPTVTDSSGGKSSTNCSYTNNGYAYGLASSTAPFQSGDQLLFVKGDGSAYTTVKLASVSQYRTSPAIVKFTFNATTASGASTSLTNDQYNIAFCNGASCPAFTPSPTNPSYLTDTFCAGNSDYILRLAPTVSYQVCSGPGSPTLPYNCDQSSNSPDIADPKLIRWQNGVGTVVMEQIIGFKVGGSVWNDPNGTSDSTYYNYNAATYTNTSNNNQAYNYTVLRSVRVSLIGRTPPQNTKNYVYRNPFDGGAYQVQGTALVVNPRNMNLEQEILNCNPSASTCP